MFKKNVLLFGNMQALTIKEGASQWVEGALTTPSPGGTTKGLIMAFKDWELKYIEAGKYIRDDRKFYTKDDLEEGLVVTYKGHDYEVNRLKDYEDADLKVYALKRKEVSGDY